MRKFLALLILGVMLFGMSGFAVAQEAPDVELVTGETVTTTLEEIPKLSVCVFPNKGIFKGDYYDGEKRTRSAFSITFENTDYWEYTQDEIDFIVAQKGSCPFIAGDKKYKLAYVLEACGIDFDVIKGVLDWYSDFEPIDKQIMANRQSAEANIE